MDSGHDVSFGATKKPNQLQFPTMATGVDKQVESERLLMKKVQVELKKEIKNDQIL